MGRRRKSSSRSKNSDRKRGHDVAAEDEVSSSESQCVGPSQSLLSIIQCRPIDDIRGGSAVEDMGFVEFYDESDGDTDERGSSRRDRKSRSLSRRPKSRPSPHCGEMFVGGEENFTVTTEGLTSHESSKSKYVRHSRRSKSSGDSIFGKLSMEDTLGVSSIPSQVQFKRDDGDFAEHSMPSHPSSSSSGYDMKRRDHRRGNSFDVSGRPESLLESHNRDPYSPPINFGEVIADDSRKLRSIEKSVALFPDAQHIHDQNRRTFEKSNSRDKPAGSDNRRYPAKSAPPDQSMASMNNPNAKYGHHSFHGSKKRTPVPALLQHGQQTEKHSNKSKHRKHQNRFMFTPSPAHAVVESPSRSENIHTVVASPERSPRPKKCPPLPPFHRPKHGRSGSTAIDGATSFVDALERGYSAGALQVGDLQTDTIVASKVSYDASTISTQRPRQQSKSPSGWRSSLIPREPSGLRGENRRAMSKLYSSDTGGANTKMAGLVDIQVPPGNMGISIHNSQHGPIIAALHPDTLCPQMNVGDIIVSLDGVKVIHFPAEAVAALIAAKSRNPVRIVRCLPGRAFTTPAGFSR